MIPGARRRRRHATSGGRRKQVGARRLRFAVRPVDFGAGLLVLLGLMAGRVLRRRSVPGRTAAIRPVDATPVRAEPVDERTETKSDDEPSGEQAALGPSFQTHPIAAGAPNTTPDRADRSAVTRQRRPTDPAGTGRHSGRGRSQSRRTRNGRHSRTTPPRSAGRRQRRNVVAVIVLVAGLVVGGLVALLDTGGAPTATPVTPPSPVASRNASPTSGSPLEAAAAPPKRQAPFRCAARTESSGDDAPVALCIPSIRVDTSVVKLGLNSDRTVQVPPLSEVREAGWYRYSAVPGEIGPTVILGHIDSAQYGEGVFFQLGRLQPGDVVELWRGDGKIATYRVNRVYEVAKTRFPTNDVYGPTSGPAIRLVTCGGQFDSATGNYLDNIIADGTLLSLRGSR